MGKLARPRRRARRARRNWCISLCVEEGRKSARDLPAELWCLCIPVCVLLPMCFSLYAPACVLLPMCLSYLRCSTVRSAHSTSATQSALPHHSSSCVQTVRAPSTPTRTTRSAPNVCLYAKFSFFSPSLVAV